MRGIEFFRNVSIGRYIAGTSYVHRSTPATKYLWLLALMVSASAAQSYVGALLPFFVAIAIGSLAGIRPGFFLRGMRPLLPLVVLMAVLQCLFAWPGDKSAVLVSFGPFSATAFKARLIALTMIRILSLMTAVSLFTAVTSEAESMHGIEDFLAPFRRLGIDSQGPALAVGVAMRFVPIVAGELESIAKAQASRGADFGSGRGGPIAKARAYLPLFVPVTVRALERAELMAEAMEARGYGEAARRRSRLASYPKQKGESLARLGALAACAASFGLDYIAQHLSN
jgi:energy-coupling factor transport system permease protein